MDEKSQPALATGAHKRDKKDDEQNAEDNSETGAAPQDDEETGLAKRLRYLGSSATELVETDVDEQSHKLFAEVVERASLSDEDAEWLRQERGLDRDVLDEMKIRSVGRELKFILKDPEAEYGAKALYDVGLYGEKMVPYQPLTGVVWKDEAEVPYRGPLIPYLDLNGSVFFLRAHKYSLRKAQRTHGQHIYVPPRTRTMLAEGDGTLVVAESEFKAVASTVFGVPAIGLPGINTFTGDQFPRLVDFLRALQGLAKLIIVFDQELKTDPNLRNYKPNPLNAWDTPYWAIWLAEQLYSDLDVPTRVGVLPADWMSEGKIDIDGALAAGRSAAEYQERVVAGSLSPRGYLRALPADAQEIVSWKLRRSDAGAYFCKKTRGTPAGRLAVRGGYGFESVVTKKVDGEEQDIRIFDLVSNFTLKIDEVVYDPEERAYRRRAVFKGPGGKMEVPEEPLNEVHLADVRSFRKYLLRTTRDCEWWGNEKQWDCVRRYVKDRASPLTVLTPMAVGYLQDQGLWLFGNCVVKDGRIFLPAPRKEGSKRSDFDVPEDVIYVGTTGFRPQALVPKGKVCLPSGRRTDSNEEVFVSLTNEGKLDVKEFWSTVKVAYGPNTNTQWYALLGIGWVLGTLISHDFEGEYPICAIGGDSGGGKTTFRSWLLTLVGFPHDYKALDAIETSLPAHRRNLKYWRSLPYALEEYRSNHADSAKFLSWIRNVFDQSAAGRATLGAKNRDEAIHARLLLSGEDFPTGDTAAIPTRLMRLSFPKNLLEHYSEKALHQLQAWAKEGLLSILARDFLLSYDEDAFEEAVRQCERKLGAMVPGLSSRLRRSYAIVGAVIGSTIVPGFDANDKGAFTDFLRSELGALHSQVREAEPILHFFERMSNLTAHDRRGVIRESEGSIWLRWPGAYTAVEKITGPFPVNANSLRGNLENLLNAVRDKKRFAHEGTQNGWGFKVDGCPSEIVEAARNCVVSDEEYAEICRDYVGRPTKTQDSGPDKPLPRGGHGRYLWPDAEVTAKDEEIDF